MIKWDSGNAMWYSVHKAINVICHKKKMKNKNHMTISIDAEKAFLKDFIYFIFRQRGREGEREEEKHQCVVASHIPLLVTWPTTQACAPTDNQTNDPVVLRPALNPLSHISQCQKKHLIKSSTHL